MRKAIKIVMAVVLAASVVASVSSDLSAKAKTKSPPAAAKTKPLKVVILVGGHGYDEKNFDKTIAWTVNYKGAKIFGYQGGHDVKAWTNPGHRRLLGNGMRWVAGRKCINTAVTAAALPTKKASAKKPSKK